VTDTPDHLRDDLDEVWRLHELLAAKVPPAQGEGGRRPQPSSRPPLQVDPVSLMDELRRYVGWWIHAARWNLKPARRINITDRTGARCPWCQGELIAWLYGDDPDPPEVLCIAPEHPATEQKRWEKHEWPRLGVLTGVREDARYGPRLPGAFER
jgi:hypothetical protein